MTQKTTNLFILMIYYGHNGDNTRMTLSNTVALMALPCLLFVRCFLMMKKRNEKRKEMVAVFGPVR